jgi:hypothetical protein
MNKKTKCVVAGTNSNGEPDFLPIFVIGTDEQIDDWTYIDAVKEESRKWGLDAYLVYHQDSSDIRFMNLFNWDNAPVYSLKMGDIPSYSLKLKNPVDIFKS